MSGEQLFKNRSSYGNRTPVLLLLACVHDAIAPAIERISTASPIPRALNMPYNILQSIPHNIRDNNI